jgi:steroid 5-alpha reductase family enzyme
MDLAGLFKLLAVGLVVVAIIMTTLWLLGLRFRNFSYVDIGWSANFAVLAILYASLTDGWLPRRWLIAAMFTFWGARLAAHLATRILGEPEEGRYVQLREEWGPKGNLNARFLGFFLFQGGLNVFLVLPLLLACLNPAPGFHALEIAGVVVWVLGLAGESLADRQLAAFKRNPENRGKVCNTGLWRYSRHPNYFFEWTIWIGYALFALASPFGWIALAMPLLMLHFLVNVTGVKATEEQALRSRGDAYRAYQATTSAFIPLPPRKPGAMR